MKKIDGKKIAEKVKDKIAKEIFESKGRRPNLAIILVGEREDSKIYVDLKEKEAKKIGIDTHLYKCDTGITEAEIFSVVEYLNSDNSIDGIIIQLPLPEQYDTDGLIYAIDSSKDVDCFHPNNLEKIFKKEDYFLSPVYASVFKSLKEINLDLKDKTVVIIANSDIFGKGLEKIFQYEKSNIFVCKEDDKDLKTKAKKADVIVTAIGKPKFIKKDMIKKDVVLIDVGITKVGKKVVGDVDEKSVAEKAAYITPVPGGIGPMTIAYLFKNTLDLYKRRNK